MDVEPMLGFGYKTAWVAVRTGDRAGDRASDLAASDQASVLRGLGLRDLGEVPWRTGIDLAYLADDRLALTPPLRGADGADWVLLVGLWFLLNDLPLVDAASATLGTEVQRFATHRVAEAHQWARAVDGRIVRAFGYLGESGEVTEWVGEPDEVEREIGLPATYTTGPQLGDTHVMVGEEDVMRIAGAWSVDPSSLAGLPAPGPLRVAATP